MSDYFLDINGSINLSDYSNIEDYIKVVDFDDSIIIRFSRENNDDVNIVEKILERDNFNIISKGDEKHGKYFIKANKKI